MEKLEKAGMTEEEWFEKKKLLKYLRERVRRAKKAKDEKALKEHQDSLNTVLAEQERVTGTSTQAQDPPSKKRKEQPSQEQPDIPTKAKTKQDENKTAIDTADITTSSTDKQRNAPDTAMAAPENMNLSQIFSRDIDWTDHPFDHSDLESPYELICCSDCTQQYSAFLSLMAKDIKEQKTHKSYQRSKRADGFLEYWKEPIVRQYSTGKTTGRNQRKDPCIVSSTSHSHDTYNLSIQLVLNGPTPNHNHQKQAN